MATSKKDKKADAAGGDAKKTAKKETKKEPAEKPKKAPAKAAAKTDAPKEKKTAEKKESKAGSANAYFVSPHPDGGWQVKKANAQKALKKFKTKAEAEAYAKQVAGNQGTGVVRQKKDGKIQKKHRRRWKVTSSLSRTSFQRRMVSWASSSSMS